MSVIFGKKALLDNIKNVQKVDLLPGRRDIITILDKHHISYTIHDEKWFDQFDDNLNHQGIISTLNNANKTVSLEEWLNKKLSQDIIVMIDSIQDPQNFGSILRTCDAFGVKTVIYKKDNQVQVNDFVIKTSMGAISNLNLIRVTNLSNALNQLKKSGYWIYASTLDDQSANYAKVQYDQKSVIIVGSEENGISPLLLKTADFNVKIPMHGNVQSLNVAVATGILLATIKVQLK
ncbi:MAG: 23S rRNA (guanosine(2251)-2'-O)-methyltransferase RlmB [Mycoplasmataceae bacterium]|nr:23S rRNA (guanosine(2251)-2'-O)-methyltransferase RlmB [Mycoplasmataceae bacterium]